MGWLRCCARASLAFVLFAAVAVAGGPVSVKGYTRKDGTYVAPHKRSAPDGNFSNNWSTAGNVNPYTGKIGTKVSPTANYGQPVDVSGHYRADGTYVQPHTRSAPDGDPTNNYSCKAPTAKSYAAPPATQPAATTPAAALGGDVVVRGYYKLDGTYVAPAAAVPATAHARAKSVLGSDADAPAILPAVRAPTQRIEPVEQPKVVPQRSAAELRQERAEISLTQRVAWTVNAVPRQTPKEANIHLAQMLRDIGRETNISPSLRQTLLDAVFVEIGRLRDHTVDLSPTFDPTPALPAPAPALKGPFTRRPSPPTASGLGSRPSSSPSYSSGYAPVVITHK